jgi:hypothetical protein
MVWSAHVANFCMGKQNESLDLKRRVKLMDQLGSEMLGGSRKMAQRKRKYFIMCPFFFSPLRCHFITAIFHNMGSFVYAPLTGPAVQTS